MFQSTPPHGGRRALRRDSAKKIGFNPRPRMGGDRTMCNLWYINSLKYVFREPPLFCPFLFNFQRTILISPLFGKAFCQSRTSPAFYVCLGFAEGYMMSGPSGSYDFFAPTCSTRFLQFLPR